MPYQNVGTPRFYINVPDWLRSVGAIESIDPLYMTTPENKVTGTATDVVQSYLPRACTEQGFVAILGHKAGGRKFVISGELADNSFDGYTLTEVLNLPPGGLVLHGVSIATISNLNHTLFKKFTVNTVDYWDNSVTVDHGCIVFGTYYDMPHSPDLKLTMSRDLDGVKRLRTKGGSDLVGYKYTKPAMWGGGNVGAWDGFGSESDSLHALSRIGRRSWNLSFSYLQGSDVFGSNQSISNFVDGPDYFIPAYASADTGYEDVDTTGPGYTYNLLSDDNFYSQVIHRLNGSQLRFLFQPDNTDPTDIAIAKLDMKSFKFKQVANGAYNVKLKIKEVW